MLKIPVPQPTSRTTLSLNKWGFWMIALRYEPVRTLSFNISSWIPEIERAQKNVSDANQPIDYKGYAPKWAYESA